MKTPRYGLLLNMQMLADGLRAKYERIQLHGITNKQKLVDARLLGEGKNPDPSLVYLAGVGTFNRLDEAEEDICYILVPDKSEEAPNRQFTGIVIHTQVDLLALFSFVQDIFTKYHQWDLRLNQIVNTGQSLHALCEAAIDMLQNPLYIHDNEFIILARPKFVMGMNEGDPIEQTDYRSIPLKRINQFRYSKEYMETLNKKKAELWFPKGNTCRTLYVNIWGDNEEYLGRMCVYELQTIFSPTHFLLADHFIRYVEIVMRRDHFGNKRRDFEDFILQLATGAQKDTTEKLHKIRLAGWKRGDRYLCMRGALPDRDIDLMALPRICSAIRTSIQGCVAAHKNREIWMIVNLDKAGMAGETCVSVMESIAREGLFNVGISHVFRDFLRAENYFRQAEIVLEREPGFNAEKHCVSFSEHALHYIVQNAPGELSAESVCAPQLIALQGFDAQNNTKYCETLRAYLDNHGQIQRTAEQLYIHRSTLTYRLGRIQQMTGLNLENPEAALYIQISFRVLDGQPAGGAADDRNGASG